MGKIIGRTKETEETIKARRQKTVDMYRSGFSIDEIITETGYVEDSIRQILRDNCPDIYGSGPIETEEDIQKLPKAVDPRRVTKELLGEKVYMDITDLIAGR